ncbi:MAG: rhomboid family intramembrane serine protease, partial [Prevotellaceae bacterium]|nr:rhomboid family intramembrane serine protease [Prevotellaceae bacterium]
MTLTIVIITVLVSIACFRRRDVFEKLLLSPYRVMHNREWWRVITHGFVHADYLHLAVNMLVLYSFGEAVELWLGATTNFPKLHYFVLYFGGMVVAGIPDLVKRKEVYHYASVGASGAVSAVLFAFIFFQPWSKLLLMGVIPIPGIIFGPLYLWYSSYMARRGGDNVNHDAHFYGAVFGFVYPLFVEPSLLQHFLSEL